MAQMDGKAAEHALSGRAGENVSRTLRPMPKALAQ
jgi:hypothetical protein